MAEANFCGLGRWRRRVEVEETTETRRAVKESETYSYYPSQPEFLPTTSNPIISPGFLITILALLILTAHDELFDGVEEDECLVRVETCGVSDVEALVSISDLYEAVWWMCRFRDFGFDMEGW